MTSLVPGDPASLSAAGGALLRAASLVGPDIEAVAAAYRDLGRDWSGRGAVAQRRRGDDLVAAGSGLCLALESVGAALQGHASDVAELAATARSVAERAAGLGLELRDGRVELAYGVVGEAEASHAAQRQTRREELQAELDVVLTQLRRRRHRLLALLSASTPVLAQAAARLRSR